VGFVGIVWKENNASRGGTEKKCRGLFLQRGKGGRRNKITGAGEDRTAQGEGGVVVFPSPFLWKEKGGVGGVGGGGPTKKTLSLHEVVTRGGTKVSPQVIKRIKLGSGTGNKNQGKRGAQLPCQLGVRSVCEVQG